MNGRHSDTGGAIVVSSAHAAAAGEAAPGDQMVGDEPADIDVQCVVGRKQALGGVRPVDEPAKADHGGVPGANNVWLQLLLNR